MEYVNTILPALQQVSNYVEEKAKRKTFSKLLNNSSQRIKEAVSLTTLNNALRESTTSIYEDSFLSNDEKARLVGVSNELGKMQLGVVQESEEKQRSLDAFNSLVATNQGNKYDVGGTLMTSDEIANKVRSQQSDPRMAEELYRDLTKQPATYTETVTSQNGRLALTSALRSASSGRLFEQQQQAILTQDGQPFIDANQNERFDEGEAISPEAASQAEKIRVTNEELAIQRTRANRIGLGGTSTGSQRSINTGNFRMKDGTVKFATIVSSVDKQTGLPSVRAYLPDSQGGYTEITEQIDRKALAGDLKFGQVTPEQKQKLKQYEDRGTINAIIDHASDKYGGILNDPEIIDDLQSLQQTKSVRKVDPVTHQKLYQVLGGDGGLDAKFIGDPVMESAYEDLRIILENNLNNRPEDVTPPPPEPTPNPETRNGTVIDSTDSALRVKGIFGN